MTNEEKEYMDYLIQNRTVLTNQIARHLDIIELLQKKLDIAVKALEEYADEGNWCNCLSWNGFMEDSEVVCDSQFGEKGFEPAQKALKEIEVIDMAGTLMSLAKEEQ